MTATPDDAATVAYVSELVSLHGDWDARKALMDEWLRGMSNQEVNQWNGFMLARMLGFFDTLVNMWTPEAKEQALRHWADIATTYRLTKDLGDKGDAA